jgi:hypothetical protein
MAWPHVLYYFKKSFLEFCWLIMGQDTLQGGGGGGVVIPRLFTGKHCSSTTLNSILAHNLQTVFKERFCKEYAT